MRRRLLSPSLYTSVWPAQLRRSRRRTRATATDAWLLLPRSRSGIPDAHERSNWNGLHVVALRRDNAIVPSADRRVRGGVTPEILVADAELGPRDRYWLLGATDRRCLTPYCDPPGDAGEADAPVLAIQGSLLTVDGDRHVGAAGVLHRQGGRAAAAVSVDVAGGVPERQSHHRRRRVLRLLRVARSSSDPPGFSKRTRAHRISRLMRDGRPSAAVPRGDREFSARGERLG